MQRGNMPTCVSVLPRFLLNEKGEYVVGITYDEDGDITAYENREKALLQLSAVTPKRLERLANELTEAAKAIINPPNGAT